MTETNAGTLLAWLTDFDPTTPWVKLKKPTADGRFEPLRARLDLQGFAAQRAVRSARARPKICRCARTRWAASRSAAARTQKDTLAAWAGLDGGQPQVFLTLVDKAGKKLTQRMLTHKTGDLSDVALAAAGADYLVAWVDERSGDPELYATKVNHALNHVAPEQRITQAPGAATDLSLVATKSGALAVWADARESEQRGLRRHLRDRPARAATPIARPAELCLQKTRTHSFAPIARAYGSGALVAWLEAASERTEGEPAHVNFAVLDEAGRLVGSVQSVNVGGGTPVTVGLDCAQQTCHAVVSVDDKRPRRAVRDRLPRRQNRKSRAHSHQQRRRLRASRRSCTARDVYIAEAQQGMARLRRLQLEW